MKIDVPTQRILSTVRPGRIAFLLNVDESEWKRCCLHIFDHFARLWGGYGNIIVPTDGKTIDPLFWALLEKFDPDHLICYRRSGKDVAIDQPEAFESYLNQHIEGWEKQIGSKAEDFQVETIRKDVMASYVSKFVISPELQEQLKDRISPFFFENSIVEATVSADEDPAYPHTQLWEVLAALRNPLPAVIIPSTESIDETLWVGSQVGYCLPSTLERLQTAGLRLREGTADNITVDSILKDIVATNFLGGQGRSLPSLADASICGLGIHRPRSFHYWEEPTVVVAGNTLQDFCFYQCLSRLRERVVWLIPSITEGALVHGNIDGEVANRRSCNFMGALHSLTKYSQTHTPSVTLISTSLGHEQLRVLLQYASGASLFGLDTWSVGSANDLLSFDPLRLYEANNARMPALVQTTEDHVVELLEPRRPKFLKDFSPSKVRWISEVSFQGHELPRHFALALWMMGRRRTQPKKFGFPLRVLHS